MRRRWALSLLLGLSLTAGACTGGGDDDGCVTVDVECAPLYSPTFDEIHTRTLAPTCALAGTSCHAPEGAQAGLVLDDIDTAYDELLGVIDHARVTPGDPSCSLLSRRLFASAPATVMPPGAPLSDAERCVFVRWINDGAAR